jgi:hypothetical protein
MACKVVIFHGLVIGSHQPSSGLHSQGEDPARRDCCHRGQWEGAGQTPHLSSAVDG